MWDKIKDNIPDRLPGDYQRAVVVRRPIPELALIKTEEGRRFNVEVPKEYLQTLPEGSHVKVVVVDDVVIDILPALRRSR